MPSASAARVSGIRDEVAQLKRERTIGVAVDLFYERGYENTTLDAIAERMGVTKPFIYAHFTSKAELLAQICSRGIASALAALEGVLTMPGTPTERLAEVGQQFIAAVLTSQRHIAIFTREEKHLLAEDCLRINDMRREFDRKLVRLLDEGVAAGEFYLNDTRIAALAIGGMVSWAYVWYRPGGRLTLEETSRKLATLILNLAGVRDAPEASDAQPRGPAPKGPPVPQGRRKT
jgi:TetR/AcrR family transcriptional regulator, cholesterol catabolism regulator